VITRKKSEYNSDFADVGSVAETMGIDCLYTDGINDLQTCEWIRGHRPEVIFCFGWSQLIGKELLDMPRLGIVGYHLVMLPANRGRHPLIWALALGLETTGSTFFFMDEGADSGDILNQRELPIAYEDNATSLYEKMCTTADNQIREFLPQLYSGKYMRVPQDHKRANLWRKRGKVDGRIDFRMSSRSVYNLVRALTRPYPGAHVETAKMDVPVWQAQEISDVQPNMEPGKVLDVRNGNITVKCGEGAVILLEHGFDPLPREGDYL